MPEILTTEEAAAALRVSPSTLRYWRMIGTGPRSFVIGRKRVFYKSADVAAFMEAAYADAVGS